MALEFTTSYLKDSTALLRYYKMLGERAMAQATDDQTHRHARPGIELHRHHREASFREHGLALDRFPDPPTAKNPAAIATLNSPRRLKRGLRSSRCGKPDGSRFSIRWRR